MLESQMAEEKVAEPKITENQQEDKKQEEKEGKKSAKKSKKKDDQDENWRKWPKISGVYDTLEGFKADLASDESFVMPDKFHVT